MSFPLRAILARRRAPALMAIIVVVSTATFMTPQPAQSQAAPGQTSALSLDGTLHGGTVGQGYSALSVVTGGTAPFTFNMPGNPPPGLSWAVQSNSVELHGTPTATGVYSLTVTVTDGNGQRASQTQLMSILAARPVARDTSPVVSIPEQAAETDVIYVTIPIIFSPSTIPSGQQGFDYGSVSFSAIGGSGNLTLSESGALPLGMSIAAANGSLRLTGTPRIGGTFPITITATDNVSGAATPQSYSLVIKNLTVSPSSFPTGAVGRPYGPATFSIDGDPAQYTLTLTGTLPPGLTVTASGESFSISGTPTMAGFYPINVLLTDISGDVDTRSVAIRIDPAPLATFASSIAPAAPLYTDQITLTLVGTGNYSAPTGILSLSMDGGAAKNYPLANGTVVLPLSRLVPGSHTLDYTYSGDSQYPATDQTYTFTVAYPPYYLTGTVSAVLDYAGFYDVVDPSDNVYIADTNNNVIHKYDLSGNLTVVPSTGLRQPRAMAFDGVGNLYIADSVNNRIVVLAPNGTQTVLPSLPLNFPSGIAFDPTYKNLWIVDQNNYQVLEYNMGSQTVTSTVTGFGNAPDAVAVAADGTVYVGTGQSFGNGRLYSFAPGAATAGVLPFSQFYGVGSLAFDRFGNLYVSDRDGNNLYRLDSSGNMTQLASGVSAGIAIDSQSTIWLAAGGVSKFVPGPAGYAGTSNSYEGGYGGTFGGTFHAFFHSPTGTTLAALAVPANNAYQAPYGFTANDSFAFANLARGPIYPGLQTGSVTATFSDGTVLKVPLYGSAFNTELAVSPGIVSQTTTNATSYGGATTDANGNIYFSDTAANKVYEVFQGIVTAVPFTGLNAPTQVAVDGNGSVYVLDSGTSRILKYNNTGTLANNTTTVAFDLSAQSALASLTAFALDGATDLYLAGANNNGQGNGYGNGLIQELSALGTYSTFSAGLVAVPTALAFDSNSQLYSGDATGLVTKFTKVGALGALAKNLGSITSMAIEPSGTVYVTTAGSAALSVVSPQGAVSSYSIAGVTNPAVMTEDKLGTLTVADSATGLLVTDVRDPNLLSPNANQTVNLGFNFPATVVGSSSPVQSYTLSNIGTTEDGNGASGLTLQGLPNLQDFPQAPSTTCVAGTTNLVAGASCVLAFTFSPTIPGNANETDYIQYSTPHANSGYSLLGPTFTGTAISQFPIISLSASSLSFGNVNIGSSAAQNVTVTNNGAATLHLTAISINGGGFTQTNNCGTTLAPFASCTVVVTFAPTSATDYSGAQLNFITDGGGNGNRNVQEVFLSGSGIQPITITPSALDLGTVSVGATNTAYFTFTNNGTSRVEIENYIQSGAGFQVVDGSTDCVPVISTTAPGASCRIYVQFTPTAAGAGNFILTVVTTAGSQTVSATGQGVIGPLPQIVITPSPIDFGTFSAGTTATKPFTLTNTGNAPAVISQLQVPLRFSLVSDSCSLSTVAAGGSCSGSISFSTNAVGALNGNLTVPSNVPTLTVPLIGTTTKLTVFLSSRNHMMETLSPDGSLPSTSSTGGGIGAAVDASGSVLSIDSTGTSLTKFTDAGAVSATLSGGGLNAATALAVDGNSNVWVANANGTLSVFTSSGSPVSAIPVAAAGNISQPASVNIDASGSVWVANTGNNTVTEIVGVAAPSPVLVNAVINATPGTKP